MSAALHDPDLPADAWGHERAEAVKAALAMIAPAPLSLKGLVDVHP